MVRADTEAEAYYMRQLTHAKETEERLRTELALARKALAAAEALMQQPSDSGYFVRDILDTSAFDAAMAEVRKVSEGGEWAMSTKEIFVVHYEDGTHTWYGSRRDADKAASEGFGSVERFIPETSLRASPQGAPPETAPEYEPCEYRVMLRPGGPACSCGLRLEPAPTAPMCDCSHCVVGGRIDTCAAEQAPQGAPQQYPSYCKSTGYVFPCGCSACDVLSGKEVENGG